MKFSIKDLETAGNSGFGHFTEKILNGKLHFLCSGGFVDVPYRD